MATRDELLQKRNALALELLGDWYIRPATRDAWKPVPVEWFGSHKLAAIAKHVNEGVAPDDLVLALSRNGAREHWPHPADAEQLLLETATRGRSYDSLRSELKETHEQLKILDALLQPELKGKSLDETIKALEALRPEDEVRPLPVMPVEDLFSELGEPPWVSKELAMQPGAPWMLSGHSGRGKSWLLTDLAIAIASGLKWGPFDVASGKVRWLHLEGSSRDLKDRVQRLSRGRNVGPDHLRGNFFASNHPRFIFTDEKLETQLSRECDGFKLAVVDTFAVAAAGLKENDSAIRAPLDMLGRVSERTGCVFAVIHHHRKDPSDPKAKVDTEMAVRGSGAINNALSASWAVSRMKCPDDALFKTKLILGKTWYGARDPLVVTGAWSAHVEGAVDLIVVREKEKPDAAGEDAPEAVDHDELDRKILLTTRDFADRELTFTALVGIVKARRSLLSERVEALRVEGRLIVDRGPRNRWLLRLPDPASDADDSTPF